MNWLWIVLVGLMIVAIVAGAYRGFCGPHQLDRVLALDYLSIVGIGVVVVLTVLTGEPMLLDIGICLALVGFLSAYLFSKFAKKD